MTDFGAVGSNIALQRTIRLGTNAWRLGGTAPSAQTLGTTPTVEALRFAATNELLSIGAFMPQNWDRALDVTLRLLWSLVDVETNADTLDVTLDYVVPVELSTGDGVAKASTNLTSNVTVTTGNGLAIGDLYFVDFTLASGDATNPFDSEATAVGFAMEIHLTNITGVTRADFLGGRLDYHALR